MKLTPKGQKMRVVLFTYRHMQIYLRSNSDKILNFENNKDYY